jgi:acetyltransferase-like isoleucine patch superfamily enzyme
MSRVRHGVFALVELLLRLSTAPRLRARLLALFGASIGHNVRVGECRLINLSNGFAHLTIEDDVHIGHGCLLDLEGPVRIGRGSVLSPRVTIISHNDPGATHDSPLAERFPPDARGVRVGEHCWIGTNSTILSGAVIGDRCVLGAMSLVKGELSSDSVYVGIPARRRP